jgi:homoserine O-acetyltransferase
MTAGSPSPAGPRPGQREIDFTVRDFRFQGGEVLPEARLHALTLGEPRRDVAGRVENAVLLLHGTHGTGRDFLAPELGGALFGPGQPLDAAHHYLILPDGLGRGRSSKPSDGLRARFPHYGYGDVVAAHHLLVTRGLGVDRLRLVLGTSMGGMQAYLWGARHPDMVDAILAIAAAPSQISGRNLLWRRILAEAIRNDPDWQGGDYTDPPRRWALVAPLFALMTTGAARLEAEGPTRAAAEALYQRLVEAARAQEPCDLLYALEASWDYDPEPELDRIRAPLLAVGFGGDLVVADEVGALRRLVPRIRRGRAVVLPGHQHDHQAMHRAELWRPLLEELLREPP